MSPTRKTPAKTSAQTASKPAGKTAAKKATRTAARPPAGARSAPGAAAAPALSPLAERLLEAHVAWWETRLEDDQLGLWLGEQIEALIADAARLRLEEVVSRSSVKAIALAYAAEIEPQGALPELVGEIARAIQASPLQGRTRLREVLPDAQFRLWLDQILGLEKARDALLSAALDNPVVAELSAELVLQGLRDHLADNPLTRRLPGAESMLRLGRSVLNRARPGLDSALEEGLQQAIQASIRQTLRGAEQALRARLSEERLRDAALMIWKQLRERSLAELRASLSPAEVEELFVTGYEYWRVLRRTPYYRGLIETGVDVFFDTYGGEPPTRLLEELGLDAAQLREDALRFAPRALAALRKKKLLAPLIRRQLAPFYASPEVAAMLDGAAG